MQVAFVFVAVISVNTCAGTEQLAYLTKCEDEAKCRQRITISRTFRYQNQRRNDYIRIQKVEDKVTRKNFTLINPQILKLYSYLPKEIYHLKLLQIVNNKVNEVYYHHDNKENFQDCDEHVLNQMCGQNLKGFCCSCDKREDNFPYHIRGGQECYINQSSAHCLQYDPLWYSVNKLEKPKLYHVMVVSLYSTGDNHVTSVKVGSCHISAEKETISVSYSLQNKGSLKNEGNLLLIPQTNNTSKSQMMLLSETQIGEECDKIGVTVKSFNHQTERCHKPAQSCLDHQPMNFWLEDRERILKRRPVKYFLQERAKGFPKIIKSGKTHWSLVIPATGIEILLSISINADQILMIPQQLQKVIRECIYVDNGLSETLSVILYNQGYLHEEVSIYLRGCNVSITGDLYQSIQLTPHRTQHIQFPFHTDISIGIFTCTVYVNGENNNDRWEITLQKQHSCVCFLHQKCNCGDFGYYRHTVLLKEGIFRGPTHLFFLMTVFLATLFSIGLVKAILSIWSPITVGEFGLCLFTQSRVLSVYQEKLLQKYDVIYNEKGVPVNPVTRKPVQILPTSELFVLNFCFGYYLLFIGVHWLMLKLSGLDTKYQHQREQKSWHQKLITPVTSPEDDFVYDKVPVDTPDKQTNLVEGVRRKLYGIADKQLAIEQYRKQKNELSKYIRKSKSIEKGEQASLKKPKKSTPVKGKARSISIMYRCMRTKMVKQ